MAEKKENLPNDAELTKVDAVEETAAEENTEVEQKPSFWQKTKGAFVSFGGKVKGVFVKKKNEPQPEAAAADDDANAPKPPVDAPSPLLEGPQLSKGERFRRFVRSQSGWLFVLPAVILMCVFTFYPIINAFIGAFKENYNTLDVQTPYTGWGFENFVRVLKGDTGTGGANFLQCLVNTTVFTLVSVPVSTLLALLISVALNSIKPLQKAYQTVLFLPYLTNSLAMGAVFLTFFSIVGTKSSTMSVGLFNNFLGLFGIDPIDWIKGGKEYTWVISDSLSIPWTKYFVVIIYEIWSGLPFKILILFSALQSVNKQYYDAAKIDGASKSTILWKITTPMISPMISYLIVTGIMGGMKQYTAIVGIFGPQMGRDYDMGTIVGYIYQYLDNGYTGYAFAGSLMLFVIIMVFTTINRYVSRKKVTY